jgi:outer membrane lipase/esterase
MSWFSSIAQFFDRMKAGPLLAAALFMTPAYAGATPIVAFGDSLSDTGNVFALTSGLIPPSEFYFNGRFSNGQIWLDRVATALDGNVAPSATGGSNFAFGAARTQASPFVPSLRVQADLFLATLPPAGADPDALYVVAGGGSDIRDALASSDPVEAVTTSAGQFAAIVDDLAEAGASNILVPSLVNVGRTPEAQQAGPVAVALAGALSRIFNRELEAELANIQQTRAVNLIQPDFFSLLEAIVAMPTIFGLSNATDPCLPGDPFELPPGIAACGNPDQYVFWDELHPTTVTHALFADAALRALGRQIVAVPEPSTLALLLPILLGTLLLRVWPSLRERILISFIAEQATVAQQRQGPGGTCGGTPPWSFRRGA